MKRFLLFACLAIIAAGCKKGLQTTPTKTQKGSTVLFAKWELRRTSGGMQPAVYHAPGNGDMIQFNTDSTYSFYTGGTISKQGTFHIAEQSYPSGKFNFIYYDQSAFGDIMTLKSDSLIIGTSAADGLESLYIKK